MALFSDSELLMIAVILDERRKGGGWRRKVNTPGKSVGERDFTEPERNVSTF